MSVTVTSLGGTVGIQGRLPSTSAAKGEADKSTLARGREGGEKGREGWKRGLLPGKLWGNQPALILHTQGKKGHGQALPSEATGKQEIAAGYNGESKRQQWCRDAHQHRIRKDTRHQDPLPPPSASQQPQSPPISRVTAPQLLLAVKATHPGVSSPACKCPALPKSQKSQAPRHTPRFRPFHGSQRDVKPRGFLVLHL